LHLIGYKDKVKSDQTKMRLHENRWIAAFESYDE
jgi:ssRNA-specific RNase YbeY (16S rRNA maturation enzyme)